MTDDTDNPPDPTVDKIRALMARRGWGHNQTARYLGVPNSTMGNWIQGTKRPSQVITRLVDVLATIELLAPHIHDSLIPEDKKKW